MNTNLVITANNVSNNIKKQSTMSLAYSYSIYSKQGNIFVGLWTSIHLMMRRNIQYPIQYDSVFVYTHSEASTYDTHQLPVVPIPPPTMEVEIKGKKYTQNKY